MYKSRRILSFILVFVLVFSMGSSIVSAEPVVIGHSTSTNLKGTGYSGYTTSWNWYNTNTLLYEVGCQTSIKFDDNRAGWLSAINMRDGINTGISSDVAGVNNAFSVFSLTPVAGGFAAGVTGILLNVVTSWSWTCPVLQAGDTIIITENCTQLRATNGTPIGSLNRTATVSVYDSSMNRRYYFTTIL